MHESNRPSIHGVQPETRHQRTQRRSRDQTVALTAVLWALVNWACQHPPKEPESVTAGGAGGGGAAHPFPQRLIAKDASNSTWRVGEDCKRLDNDPITFYKLEESGNNWVCGP
jgi:hypothetical protein